jgi:hypothetical protein
MGQKMTEGQVIAVVPGMATKTQHGDTERDEFKIQNAKFKIGFDWWCASPRVLNFEF